MIFSTFSVNLLQRIHGRKLAALIAQTSEDRITERTLRNWISARTSPESERIEDLRQGGRSWLSKDLARKGWSPAECDAFVSGMDACPGLLSGFLFAMHSPFNQYPASLELARKLDLLDQRLMAYRASDDLPGYVNALLSTGWLRDEHLNNPDDDGGAEITRRQVNTATSWEDLAVPVAVIFINTQFELLATLDLEFCSRYLTSFEAAPIFASLLPRFDPRVDLAGKTTIPTTRDLYHYPVRRLLHVLGCMRSTRHDKTWPKSAPTVGEMVLWLELAGEGELAKNVVKWRTGRPFTIEQFLRYWGACFAFLDENERPAAPMPLMYAASVFTELFVKGSREGRDLTFISPDPAFYLHWWNLQHASLMAEAEPLRFGTEKWMPNLL
jgi:hypothetical protein